MLAMTLALTLLAQGPGPAEKWASTGSEAAPAGEFVVEGTLEIERAAAEEAALRAVHAARRQRIQEEGQATAARVAPFWLPDFLVRREVDQWVARCEQFGSLRVVDSDTAVRSYSYGDAYVTTLRAVVDSPRGGGGDEQRLTRDIRDTGRLFLAKCGGIAVYWGLLALLHSWFDRLTRGYMTWRLRLIALGLGLAVPPVALLV